MPKLKDVLFFLLLCTAFSFASKEKDFTVNVNESVRGKITLEFNIDNYTITGVNRKGDAYSKVSFKGGVFTDLSCFCKHRIWTEFELDILI